VCGKFKGVVNVYLTLSVSNMMYSALQIFPMLVTSDTVCEYFPACVCYIQMKKSAVHLHCCSFSSYELILDDILFCRSCHDSGVTSHM
jgi:hypothetical protein